MRCYFPQPAEVPQGKVIFPDKKITSQVNPQNECVGNFTPQSQIILSNLDWFGDYIIPHCAMDIIFPKPVSVPLCKVIFLNENWFIKG